ncbi:Nucleic-acid-binding protein from transposon X-element [Eumeta japonica]|uniref:Nucleic-acid-binding protein from transposon X-element n=1 Tax=Eumeta variegata TaxID=151549 RepID=A0A4C2AC53_EUMVA|nr:Nucleic-acid-binding protein from transposon X-element [Eumeta japonica]
MNTHTSRPTTAGGSGKEPMVTLTMDQLKALLTQILAEKGIALPEHSLNDVASTAMSRSASPSPSIVSGKRPASARSSDASTDQSDGTVRGSDSNGDDCFTTVANKKRSTRSRKRRNAANNNPSMDIDVQSAAPTSFIDSPASPDCPDTPVAYGPVNAANQATHTIQPPKTSDAKPTAPPKIKPPPPIYLRDKSKWNAVSAECSRLHINYTSARNTLHGIKITVESISDFRSLNSLLIKSKFPFHTYALEEERKIKAVLRNIPLEIPTDCIKSDLEKQNYPVFAVHRMHRRDGTEIDLVLAVLHKSDAAKDIFQSPPRVCGLSGIIVEAPYKKSGPGQCFRCQLYGHAAQNCYAQPRCVKCREPHATKDCKRSKDSGDIPECVNCNSEGHPASYRGCPKAPHFFKKSNGNKKVTSKPSAPGTNNKNFPALAGKTPRMASDVTRSTAPPPVTNAWFRTTPKVVPEPVKEATREPPKPASAKQKDSSAGPLGEDILTIMSMLKVIKSPEFAQLAADFRQARSGEDRLTVILRHQDLLNRLEKI